ncbi:hypothetical protein PHYBOEH_006614 [Phytophthora boehmeriae]|uniref:FYVE-type domain-containing protein n=1 Tax=Phytophthora boehmeriae TaxID=109152 RepID=A0A8T1WEC0_9STRA|nr:hypothetical protein PHYBOEH_006614 [Phytophthora boehmeriae]
MKFPLAQAPFPPLNLSGGDKQSVVELADLFVSQMLSDYEVHLTDDHGVVNEVRWKMVKRFEDVVVYQDREAVRPRRMTQDGRWQEQGPVKDMQKLLWFGTVSGNLDDIMYAVVNPTADDAKVKAAFVGNNVLDFAVLDTVVHPTPDDPFRGLQIKWAVNGGPTLMRSVVRCRDFVYLESTGMTTNSTGERIGYHILHSIAVPGAPELHEHKVIRGNMTLYHLYRQKSDGVVETYVKAFIDVMGDMPASIATLVSAKGVVTVWKLGEYAEMKKLMWLLQQQGKTSRRYNKSNACQMCYKEFGSLTRKQVCRVCSSWVCSRCSVSKRVYLMSPLTHSVMHASVAVCTPCMRTVLTTNGLDVALDELGRESRHDCDFLAARSSVGDTSSPSSSVSSSTRY